MYEQRDNTGSLFKNEEKTNEKGPDYSGSCLVDGTSYFFDAWLKVSENGRRWMSFSFKPKTKQAASKPAVKRVPPSSRFNDMDDSVPF